MKEILKKYSPKRENINLGWLNKHLHNPSLWKWNKNTIAKAFAIGLFCAFLPLPIHTLLAGILAIIFSANILLSILVVWVTVTLSYKPADSDHPFGHTKAEYLSAVIEGVLIVLAALDLNKLGIPSAVINSELISLYRIIFIVALVGWTTSARLVRGAALSIRERDFVLAARAQGASAWRIMGVHILPNLVSPIIVATTLSAGKIILLESVLSFLGLGIQPPIASWGNQLTNAQELIYEAPMLAVWPGLAIFTTVVAFNFLGDGLQDALDPKALAR